MLELDQRTARAVALLALAAAAVLAVGIVYLRPNLSSLTIGAPSSGGIIHGSPPQSTGIVYSSFGDPEHGMVQLLAPSPTTFQGLQVSFVTRDGGRTWSRLPGPGTYVFAGPRRLLDYSGSGTRLSDDGGRSWRTLPDPRRGFTSSLYPLPTFIDSQNGWWLDSYTAAAPQSVGLWRTRDGGHTWSWLDASGVPDAGIKSSPTFTDSTHGFITVSSGSSVNEARAILETLDGGESWRQVASVTAPALDSFLIGPVSIVSHGRRVVAALQSVRGVTIESGGYRFPSTPVVIQVVTLTSNDAGQTWGPPSLGPTTIGPGPYELESTAPAMDGAGRLALLDAHRLWTSDDGGASWTARLALMPESTYPLGRLQAVAGALFVPAMRRPMPPGISATAAPLVPEVLLRSRDGGIHWENVLLPAPRRVV